MTVRYSDELRWRKEKLERMSCVQFTEFSNCGFREIVRAREFYAATCACAGEASSNYLDPNPVSTLNKYDAVFCVVRLEIIFT
jgi:hypothetical protein